MEPIDISEDVLPGLTDVLLDTLTVGVVVCDVRSADEQPIVYANPGFEQLTGYPAAEVLGRDCRLLQGPDTSSLARAAMRESIAVGAAVTVAALNYRRDGSTFWNEIRIVPLAGHAGHRPTHFLGLMTDVTPRIEVEGDLAHAEILRSTAFNSMPDGVMLIDSTGVVGDANASAQQILGLSLAELARADWWERLRFRWPDGSAVSAADSPGRRVMQTREPIFGLRLMLRRPAGDDRLILCNYEPLPGGDEDQPGGIVLSFGDVTEHDRSSVDLQMFASLVEISRDFIAIADLDGTVRYVNPAGRALVGLDSLEAAQAADIRDFLTEEGLRASIEVERPAVIAHGRWQGESTLRHFQTGAAIPVRIDSYLVRHPETREPVALATVQRDISEQQRTDAELRRGRARYEAQFRSLPVPTYVWRHEDDDFVLVDWNEAAEEISRNAIHGFRGARASEMHEDDTEVRTALARCAATGEQESRQQTYRMRTTDEVKQLVVTYAWVPPDTVLVHTLDVTERVRSEQILKRLAEEDDLTGLHNRRYIERRLGEALGHRPVAVIFVDIDHFKFVNDAFGHDAGDDLLREAAELMSARLGDGSLLARFGGDEFALLLEDRDETETASVVNDLLAAIRSRVGRASVTASAGAAVFADDAEITTSDAIVAADIALYAAKQGGRDRLEFYRGEAGENLAWVQGVRDAIAEDRLLLVAQPIIDLRGDGRPVGYELLVRMRTPDGRVLPPSAFLPTAEQFGLMRELDRWVLARGIAIAARGHRVGINLSARSIGDPALPDHIAEIIARTGARPQDVVFEFTETAAVSSISDARSFTEALNALGCSVALDDFGTGFGTFMLLKHLPVSILKIDMEFVRELATEAADQRIVRLIVHIAREAGTRTIAEGVEDAGALALLTEYGVDAAQGYHIAPPGPLPE